MSRPFGRDRTGQRAGEAGGRLAIVEDGPAQRAVGGNRRQHRLDALQERRRMGQVAVHAGQDQRLGLVAELVEPQDQRPGLGRQRPPRRRAWAVAGRAPACAVPARSCPLAPLRRSARRAGRRVRTG